MKGEFLALIVATLWGITPLIEKKALNYIDPLTAVFIIICMNFLIISSVFIIFGKINMADLSSIPIKPIIYLAMVSILAGIVAQYLFYRALETSSPSKVVIITSMYPLITLLATSIISKEFPSIKMVCGAFLVFMGIFLVMD
ncbi:EamA family transporter [Methanothermococcus sp.]|uniref:EamA family transporter n=1 Tax=Methanothermococcus sp. TaxID=2614238 RepID=UPI0025E62120|nr:DMT family transporter [Methanothermococcus sp.]